MDDSVVRPPSSRLHSIDAVRGLVMILMALDHVRGFFGGTGGPENLATTTPALFLTRWVTHICAPTFVLLAGTAAWIYGSKGRTKGELATFLWTRGLWLVFLELTVVSFGWVHFFGFVFWQVIAAIGVAMIALAGIVFLPHLLIVALGLLIVGGHNLLDPLEQADFGAYSEVWHFLHEGFWVQFGLVDAGLAQILVVYPVLPWIGVMALGYAIGPLTKLEPARRKKTFLALGFALTVGFIALRAVNGYGDPSPWESQADPSRTWISFLKCTKYPPSMLFSMMTLGPMFLLLGLLDRKPGKLTDMLIVFGRVPLFYYVAHIFLISYGSRLYHWLTFGESVSISNSAMAGLHPNFQQLPKGFEGMSLSEFYVAWIVVVVLLYPLCVWYGRVKGASKSRWFSYL